jgi:hypothetical protein
MINKRLFVSSKFRSDDWSTEEENVYWAKVYARFVVKHLEMIPIVPHLIHVRYLDDNNPEERELGIEICKLELLNSDSVVFFIRDSLPEESRMSFGMMAEYEFAELNGLDINYVIHDDEGVIVMTYGSNVSGLIGTNLQYLEVVLHE